MKWQVALLAAGVVMLLLADFLAFHDLFESHTVRDWLTLAGSALAFVALVGGLAGPRLAARLRLR